MLEGKKTYISILCIAIYNIMFPLLGIKEITADEVDITVNTILVIAAAISRKLAKPKAKSG